MKILRADGDFVINSLHVYHLKKRDKVLPTNFYMTCKVYKDKNLYMPFKVTSSSCQNFQALASVIFILFFSQPEQI